MTTLCRQARDDAFAAVVDIDEREDEEKERDTLQTSCVNFQLVPSELKPYTRYLQFSVVNLLHFRSRRLYEHCERNSGCYKKVSKVWDEHHENVLKESSTKYSQIKEIKCKMKQLNAKLNEV